MMKMFTGYVLYYWLLGKPADASEKAASIFGLSPDKDTKMASWWK